MSYFYHLCKVQLNSFLLSLCNKSVILSSAPKIMLKKKAPRKDAFKIVN